MKVTKFNETCLSYRTGNVYGNCYFVIDDIPYDIVEKLPHEVKTQYDGFTSETEAAIAARANCRQIEKVINQ